MRDDVSTDTMPVTVATKNGGLLILYYKTAEWLRVVRNSKPNITRWTVHTGTGRTLDCVYVASDFVEEV